MQIGKSLTFKIVQIYHLVWSILVYKLNYNKPVNIDCNIVTFVERHAILFRKMLSPLGSNAIQRS